MKDIRVTIELLDAAGECAQKYGMTYDSGLVDPASVAEVVAATFKKISGYGTFPAPMPILVEEK